MTRALALAVVCVGVTPVVAQTGGQAGALEKFAPVRQLLADGYDIKTGFADNTGGAYLVLQKATSAFLCHSSPRQVCEKLN
ncbi:hypothetical protein P7D22_08410 [Lichenihabitans sp. Uapishka_5]|uniref:hypothetical protein n=1 Tax=Lichenihabitans sp. Uapishka_5 TaxID=3037302 RepID=UPI0029E81575|nr:hypothetical protein [Lichenihabitans sp. Uapishka_5]MDX7951199.1 hypothetical protein [Lichenihabitans sp. Uapishka_5]